MAQPFLPVTAQCFCPQGYLGCQALSEMIQFYLEEVMPQAESQGPDIKEPVNSLGEKLKTLRLQLRRCVSSRPAPSLAALGLLGNTHLLTPLTPRHTHWVAGACSFLSELGGGGGREGLLGIYMRKFANSFPVICESSVAY